MASQAQHLGAIDAAAWLPLAWLAWWRSPSGSSGDGWPALACALAMSILAGFPAASAVVFHLLSLLLALILARCGRHPGACRYTWRRAAVWAVLLSAIQSFRPCNSRA
jgi:hypothetical protein